MARQSLIPSRVKNTGLDLLVAGLFLGGGVLALGYANKRFGIVDKIVSGAGSVGFGIGQATGSGLASIPKGIFAGLTGIDLNKATGFIKGPASPDFINAPSTPSNAVSYTQDSSGKVTVKDASGNIIPQAYGDSGENQNFFASLITAIEKNPFEDTTRNLTSGATFRNFTDIFKDIQAAPAGGATPKAPLNVADLIKQAGQRISQQSTLAQNKKITNQYGTLTTKNPFGGFASANQQETTLQALIAANAKKYPQYFKVV